MNDLFFHNAFLSQKRINSLLSPSAVAKKILVLDSVDSTNKFVKSKAAEGECDGYTVIANEQTAGRGRLGRSFFSPCGSGLYMSILLRPENFSASMAFKITAVAAVAVCEAIEALSDKKAEIKWVNDVYIGGKKVCGILTEASFNSDTSEIDYAVIGIGVNILPPDGGFPDEISNIAGAVYSEDALPDDIKNRLSAEIINRFSKYYLADNGSEYVEEYRKRNIVPGRRVIIISQGSSREATAIDIDQECRLKVRYDDGSEELLSSGEISIRF